MTFQGGTSTGQNVADACDVRANLPELNTGIGAGLVGSTVSTTSPYCHVAYGMLTQVRGLGSYTIPKIDAQVSAIFQSKPGALLSANYAVPAATVAQSLGRPPSGNVTNVTVNLLEPGSRYGDRINQLDFRFAKILRFGGNPDDGVARPVQHAECQRGADLQQHVRPRRDLAAGELDPDGTAGSNQRGIQLVTFKAGRVVGT